jgi:hypothetical protein
MIFTMTKTGKGVYSVVHVIHKIPNSVVCSSLSFLAVYCDFYAVTVYGTQKNPFIALCKTGGWTNTIST